MQTYNFICVTTNKYSENFIELINSIKSIDTTEEIKKKMYIYSMNDWENIQSNENIIINKKFVGLSKARNELIRKVNEGYIILCDDDAVYDKTLLIKLSEEINKTNNNDIYMVKLLNKENNKAYGNRKYPEKSKILSNSEAVSLGISLNLIIPFTILKECNYFNEDLGVGSKGMAGEETDLLLKILDKKIKCIYINGINVRHPAQDTKNTNLKKVYDYSYGYRKMIDSSEVNFSLKMTCYLIVLKSIVKNIIAFIVFKEQRKVRWMRIKGLLLI